MIDDTIPGCVASLPLYIGVGASPTVTPWGKADLAMAI